MRGAPLVLLVVALAGCRYGSAGFEGTLGDRPFEPTGTVFSYVDARDEALAVDDDADPPVAIAMTWLVFDPTADLGDEDGARLAALAHELRLRDALSLVVARQSLVEVGASLESRVRGDAELADGQLRSVVHLAPERLDASKTYADFVPFAGERVVRLEIDEVDFETGGGVSGRVSVAFERADGDPGQVREGAVQGGFRAPLVEERVAERNLSLLEGEEVLGLPLRAPAGGVP